MKILVVAVGGLKSRAVAELVAEYGKRLSSRASIEWVEVKALAAEAERIKAKVPKGAMTVALWERGKKLDSEGFAGFVGEARDMGRHLCFVIGGARGLDAEFVKSAEAVLSLSPMTLPHELCRAVLSEQVYRAFTILFGEPYHRG